MERHFVYSPYDSWYDFRENMPLPHEGESWEIGQARRPLPRYSDDYLKQKYGLKKVYWYRHYHPPTYPQMYWRKWIVQGRKI
jgi:hypothetical protein